MMIWRRYIRRERYVKLLIHDKADCESFTMVKISQSVIQGIPCPVCSFLLDGGSSTSTKVSSSLLN